METSPIDLLIVEDDNNTVAFLKKSLVSMISMKNSNIYLANSYEKALETVVKFPPDIVISDVRIDGDEKGLMLLDKLKADYPNIVVIIMTGYSNKGKAIEVVRRGAFDFIEKPIDANEFSMVVERAVSFKKLINKNERNRFSEQESSKLTQALIDAVGDPFFYIDKMGRLTACNDIFASDFLGIEKKEAMGCEITALLAALPDDRKNNFSKLIDLFKSQSKKKKGTLINLVIEGEKRDYWIVKREVYGEQETFQGELGLLTDVTDLDTARDQIVEREQRYKQLFDNMASAAIVSEPVEGDNDFIIKEFNYTASKAEGKVKEDVIGKRISEALPHSLKSGLIAFLKNVSKTGISEYFLESIVDENGNKTELWREYWIYRLAKGEVVLLYNDVTDRKRFEDELRQSENRWRAVSETAQDAIIILDKDCRITSWNNAAITIFGWQKGEMLGKDFLEVINPRKIESIDFIRNLESSDIDKYKGKIFEFYAVTKREVEIAVEFSISFVDIDDEWNSIIILRDASQRKNMEAKLLQAAKLAEIGNLSAHVAHELNTPLSAVDGFANIIRNRIDDKAKVIDRVSKIKKAAQRMKLLVDHLRQFSRESNPDDWRQLNINDPIKDSLIFLEGRLEKASIKLTLSLEKRLNDIWGDHNQLESIVQNFITNSIDSFDKIEDSRARMIKISTKNDEKGIHILFEDNGCGMPKEIRNKMFTPFYTTKGMGKGTGLGMAIVHEIIGKHRGTISVDTKEGVGTCFDIYLPVDRREGRRVGDEDSHKVFRELNEARRKPLILVVDDEKDICDLLEDYLSDDFILKTFTQSKLAEAEIEKTKYDLILTDMTMPDSSGLAVLFVARKVQPETPVVFISGYDSTDKDINYGIKQGAKGVLLKPFDDPDVVIERLKKFIEE